MPKILPTTECRSSSSRCCLATRPCNASRATWPCNPVGEETVALGASIGRVVAQTLRSPVDVPPFDRALVDGYALHAEDTKQANKRSPIRLRVNPETIACGTAPEVEVASLTATPIATSGPLPRGADAVCMVEHTDPDGPDVLIRRSLTPGQYVGFAGSDIRAVKPCCGGAARSGPAKSAC